MSKRFVMGGDTHIIDTKTNEEYYAPCETELLDLLNELHEETQLLKCALALDEVTNISLNDKKVDIPPYYEFENYQQLKKERREEYDEYW